MSYFVNSERSARWHGFHEFSRKIDQLEMPADWKPTNTNPFFFVEAEAKRLPIRADRVAFIANFNTVEQWKAMKGEWRHLAEAQWAFEDGDMMMFEDHLVMAQELRERAEAYSRAKKGLVAA
jgi:hypothetical protein